MTVFEAFILGMLQGITEFLPISSSGHLIFGQHSLGLKVEDLKSFDVVVHLGSLMAIFVYFRRDIWEMIKSFGNLIIGKIDKNDPFLKLILFILVGTVPAVLVGFILGNQIDGFFRNPFTVSICMIFMGIVFLIAEFFHKRKFSQKIAEFGDEIKDTFVPDGYKKKEVRGMKWHKAVLIGLGQAAALIPGISRSGSTISTGLLLGIKREAAARFSFLLGIPAIFGAGLLTFLQVPENGGLGVNLMPLIIGFVTSFAFGFASVFFLMNYLKKHTLKIFAVYLIAFGLLFLNI